MPYFIPQLQSIIIENHFICNEKLVFISKKPHIMVPILSDSPFQNFFLTPGLRKPAKSVHILHQTSGFYMISGFCITNHFLCFTSVNLVSQTNPAPTYLIPWVTSDNTRRIFYGRSFRYYILLFG